MLLLIDNYDSFTYNLYQYLCELGADVRVVRNDAASIAEMEAMGPERVVISPGPCTPRQAGGGIVYDSVPERERQETVNKAKALLTAIDQAELAEAQAPRGSLGY